MTNFPHVRALLDLPGMRNKVTAAQRGELDAVDQQLTEGTITPEDAHARLQRVLVPTGKKKKKRARRKSPRK